MDPIEQTESTAPDPEQPIAWRGVPENTHVRSSDGIDVGTLYDMLGSDEEDIFHGIVVQLGRLPHRVFIPADDVTLMTTSHVDVDLPADQIHALPKHTEEREYEVGWTGLRKHLGWVREKDRQ